MLVAPGIADRYNLAKLLALAVIAGCLVVLWIWRSVARGHLNLPTGLLGTALGAFGLSLVIATIAAPVLALAILGTYGRYDGLLTILACLVLFLAVAFSFDQKAVERLRLALVATATLVAVITLIESLAVHGFGSHVHVDATVGNQDFLAAYLGLVSPLALSLVIAADSPRRTRLLAGGAAVLLLGASLAAGAVQGPVVAVLADLVVLAGWTADSVRRSPRGSRAVVAVAAVIAVVAAVGVFGVGPLGRIGQIRTLRIRRLYWRTALAMFAHHPVAGVGLGSFADHYFQYWSVPATHFLGAQRFADAANNVPLAMFSEGGVLLGVSYLVVVGVVAARLLRTVWTQPRSPQRDLLLGFGGAWIGYQLQSLISIDKITLVVLNWTLAGVIVALTAPAARIRQIRLPGLTISSAPRPSTSSVVAAAFGSVLLIIGLIPLVRLLAADAAFHHGVGQSRPADAAHWDGRAADEAGWYPIYADTEGQALAAADDLPGAAAAYRKAVAADRLDRTGRLGIADADVAAGQVGAAKAEYDETAAHDIHDPVLELGRGVLALRQGNTGLALRDVDRSLRLHRTRSAVQFRRIVISQRKSRP